MTGKEKRLSSLGPGTGFVQRNKDLPKTHDVGSVDQTEADANHRPAEPGKPAEPTAASANGLGAVHCSGSLFQFGDIRPDDALPDNRRRAHFVPSEIRIEQPGPDHLEPLEMKEDQRLLIHHHRVIALHDSIIGNIPWS